MESAVINTMNKSEKAMNAKVQRALRNVQVQLEIKNAEAVLNRASSVVVGTAFNGVTEVSMRVHDRVTWAVLQPVEVVELIHQLAANIGCHINLQARKDFASWRDWRVTEEDKKHLNGHVPFANDLAVHKDKGAILPPAEMQVGMNLERKEHEPVAIKENIDQRSTQSTTATS